MKRRGFSMVEVMISTMMATMLLGALISMFIMVSSRAEDAVSKTTANDQAQTLINLIEPHIRNSSEVIVSTNPQGTTLKCTLYANAIDLDQDSRPDKYSLNMVGNDGKPKFGKGKRVTYYLSNSGGTISATAGSRTWLWRAWRDDDAAPGVADTDQKFAKYYGRNLSAWNLVTFMDFSVDNTNNKATVLVRVKVPSANRTPSELTFTRTIPFARGQF